MPKFKSAISSNVASRLSFTKAQPSSERQTQKKPTLISQPFPLSSSSTANSRPPHDDYKPSLLPVPTRTRTDSNVSVQTIRPSQPIVPLISKTLKRARVESFDSQNVDASRVGDAPQTRQRTSPIVSATAMVADDIPTIPDEVMDDVETVEPIRKLKSARERLKIPSHYRVGQASTVGSKLDPGRAAPAPVALTTEGGATQHSDLIPFPSDTPQVSVSDAPLTSNDSFASTKSPTQTHTRSDSMVSIGGTIKFARKSEHITRDNHPPVPTQWQSAHFPPMLSGLREYHDRFRDRTLSTPQLQLASNIIPSHLLPERAVYEPEEDEDIVETSQDDAGMWYPVSDSYGNLIELSARHLDLSVTFNRRRPYFEVWDMDDCPFIWQPARINFMLKDSEMFNHRAIPPRPDLRCIDIVARSFDYHSKPASKGKEGLPPVKEIPEYTVGYRGWTLKNKKTEVEPKDVLSRGILLQSRWGKRYPHSSKSDNKPSDHKEEPEEEDESLLERKGWYLQVWIPVPVSLFLSKESRAFEVEVAAWIGEEDAGGIITSKTDMVISHLRSHREMS